MWFQFSTKVLEKTILDKDWDKNKVSIFKRKFIFRTKFIFA